MTYGHVVVCVSLRGFPSAFEHELNKVFLDAGLEVSRIQKKCSLLFYLKTPDFNFELLNNSLMYLSSLHQIDIGIIPRKIFEAKKGLVVFDMDSTLIAAEVIDEMALRHQVGEKVKLITARAMNGELDFNQSLTERVSLLKGFPRAEMESILKSLPFTPGTPEFLESLRRLGIKTAIASGGFEYFARSIQAQLGMDYVFANNLEFENERLTGNIQGPIVNAEFKQQVVQDLAKKENLSLEQVVAIGDGANDIPMLLTAGLGIAIHAKEKVQKSARYRMNFSPMNAALSFMNLDE